jgi:Flp pilus assembly protein TadD
MRTLSAGILVALAIAGCTRTEQGMDHSADRQSLDSAQAALVDGEAGTSLAIARGILSSQPRNPAALAQAGDAEMQMGDRLNAEADYRRALAVSPHDVKARLGMAKMMLRDDLHGAEMAFRAILADAPHNPIVLNDLGYALDLQDRHKEAQTYYVEALASDPNRLSVRVNLALSLALSGQAPRAEAMLRDLAQTAGATSKVRLDLALAQVMAGHDNEAAATMSTELSPDDAKQALLGMKELKPVGTVTVEESSSPK